MLIVAYAKVSSSVTSASGFILAISLSKAGTRIEILLNCLMSCTVTSSPPLRMGLPSFVQPVSHESGVSW
ncbi:MAG: hypothetical protein QW768_06740, partial [Thermoproteota archaeon]